MPEVAVVEQARPVSRERRLGGWQRKLIKKDQEISRLRDEVAVLRLAISKIQKGLEKPPITPAYNYRGFRAGN